MRRSTVGSALRKGAIGPKLSSQVEQVVTGRTIARPTNIAQYQGAVETIRRMGVGRAAKLLGVGRTNLQDQLTRGVLSDRIIDALQTRHPYLVKLYVRELVVNVDNGQIVEDRTGGAKAGDAVPQGEDARLAWVLHRDTTMATALEQIERNVRHFQGQVESADTISQHPSADSDRVSLIVLYAYEVWYREPDGARDPPPGVPRAFPPTRTAWLPPSPQVQAEQRILFGDVAADEAERLRQGRKP